MDGPRLHEDEVATDVALVRRLLRAQHPQWADLPIEPVPSTGTVHWLYRIGDDLVARLPRIEHGVTEIAKERRWLPMLAAALPTQVPEIVAPGAPSEEYPWSWAICCWLDGEHPDPGQLRDPHGLALDLAAVVAAIQRIPIDGAPRGWRQERLESRDEVTRTSLERATDLLDADALTGIWDETLVGVGRPELYTWQHGDLLPGNLLLDPVTGRLRAVIDFGCTGTGDPAVDLLPAWSVLDATSRRTFRKALAVDDATWTRGRGWALSVSAPCVPYYRDTNPGLAQVALRTLAEVARDAS